MPLQLQNLSSPFLASTSFVLQDRQTLTIFGSSGSGKTLLLRAIADLDPTKGTAYLDNKNRLDYSAANWRLRVAFLPAESEWWFDQVKPHITHWNKDLLHGLGFEDDVLHWSIERLSSGEKQRLAIARTLSLKPKALLLDEATANLDESNIERVEALIKQYQELTYSPVIWVSHSAAQRSRISNYQAEMKAGTLQPWN